ncbi:hypothetical protein SDC9_94777 [bioreactor metagenome]|uniref:Apea-like HEPN domain-containing protein n=1 Tax=bioreactor metagenome TaxID=1076179 RepID=A0A645A4D5_9ZZZZ
MIFEFLISYRHEPDSDIFAVLCNVLSDVLIDDDEFSDEQIRRMIILNYQRLGIEMTDEDENVFSHMLLGFTLDLPDDVSRVLTIDQFIETLKETPPILHVVKFEDPLLQQELARRAAEIFNLEMKLRRVLSFIYLHAYQQGDPYNLLHEESVRFAKEPSRDQMRGNVENQFFHLTFSQYINLNQRPEIKLPALLDILRSAEQYDSFRSEIIRVPIQQEEDASFLAGLKERMDAIETMRNCMAHNRRPSRRVTDNYENALPLLERQLDAYLERWTWDARTVVDSRE